MSTELTTSNHSTHLMRVLIVDDMPHVRQELRTLLQLTGELEVVGEAANGQEAIALAEQLRPEVVVMDLEMPVMDGVTATRVIKMRGWAKRIVILSVHADTASVQRARDAGADVVVDKAAHLQTLIAVVAAKY